MSFNLPFAIFVGALLVAIAWVAGLLATKLRLSYYDNRMTEAKIKRSPANSQYPWFNLSTRGLVADQT